MKKIQLILFTLMMATVMAASVALAQPQMGERPERPEPRGPLGLLAKFQHQNLTVAVLAKLTGADAVTLASELELSHPGDILASYEIGMETFIAEMDAKMTVLVEAAIAAGTISQDQGDEIIDMIINKPERPEPPEEGEMPPRFKYEE